ncbi:MAG: hypothetical protein B7X07_04315 [Actinobacteria bacterium 21-64-8]|nr:MAG: hypothetical protein B7X07_04315 [Actinobacteria bacterium 21-64-8]
MESRRYAVTVGTQEIELPVVTLNDDLALALLITVDMGVRFMAKAGEELADVLRAYDVDIVATVATMGIPLAVEVTRHLGLVTSPTPLASPCARSRRTLINDCSLIALAYPTSKESAWRSWTT